MEKKMTTVKLEAELREWIEKKALEKRRTLSVVIRDILWAAKDSEEGK